MKMPAEAVECYRCELAEHRKNVVWGLGPPDADIMILGEKPGKNEDEYGYPFIGKAGDLLNRILDDAGAPRPTVYVTNRVRCRPPGDRAPMPLEKEACEAWLWEEIDSVQPRLVICAGVAASSLMFPGEKLRDLRRTVRITERHGRPLLWLPTYHPAAALHDDESSAMLIRLITDDIRWGCQLLEELDG